MATATKKSKAEKTTGSKDPRDFTPAQRREHFLALKQEKSKDWHVLKDDEVEELVPYNFVALDYALRLYGMAGRGSVIQIHGDEGSGKCVGATQIINTPSGYKYVGEIFEENGLEPTTTTKVTPLEYPLFNRYGSVENTSHFTHNGKRPVFAITTRTGNVIKSTANHPHLIIDEIGNWVWRKTEDLAFGDFLVTRRGQGDSSYSEGLEDDLLYFVGCLLADGSFQPNRVSITNNDPGVLEVAKKQGQSIFGVDFNEYPKVDSPGSFDLHFNCRETVNKFYAEFGYKPGVAANKELGKKVRTLGISGLRDVIRGYFDCECSISKTGIETSSASHKLLLEIKTVLQGSFQILSVLAPKKVAAYPDNEYWRLSITGESAVRFKQLMGFKSEVRIAESSVIAEDTIHNTNIDVVPNCGQLIKSVYDSSETNVELNKLTRDYKGKGSRANLTYSRLDRIVEAEWTPSLALDRLKEIREANFFYDEIESIVEQDPEATFDFTMPQTHSFQIANVVTHNSTLAYCVNREYQKQTSEPIVYFDFERTTTADYLQKLGLDMEMAYIVRPDTMEDAVKELIKFLDAGVRLFTFDSIPRMKSKVDKKLIMSGKAFTQQVGADALMMKKFYDLVLPYIAGADGRLIMVNQTRSRIEMTQEAKSAAQGYSTITNLNYTLPGGKANRFAICVMLELTLQKAYKPGAYKDDDFILEAEAKHGEQYLANRVRVRSLKNKTTGTGYREAAIWIRPGYGVDEDISVREMARTFKLIANHGKKWYIGETFEMALHVFEDKAAAIEALVNNPDPEIMQKLRELVITHLKADDSQFAFDMDDDTARYLAGESADEVEEVDHSMDVELADDDL